MQRWMLTLSYVFEVKIGIWLVRYSALEINLEKECYWRAFGSPPATTAQGGVKDFDMNICVFSPRVEVHLHQVSESSWAFNIRTFMMFPLWCTSRNALDINQQWFNAGDGAFCSTWELGKACCRKIEGIIRVWDALDTKEALFTWNIAVKKDEKTLEH